MDTVTFVRADEQLQPAMSGLTAIDQSPVVGDWINTNSSTPGIARVIVSGRGDHLSIQVFAASGPTPREWGEAEVEAVYSNGVAAPAAMAFVASYDFRGLEVRVEANLSLGLLVVATFNTFTDGSGRSNFFAREFFYRADEPSREESHE